MVIPHGWELTSEAKQVMGFDHVCMSLSRTHTWVRALDLVLGRNACPA
jgi:hypothetical protein